MKPFLRHWCAPSWWSQFSTTLYDAPVPGQYVYGFARLTSVYTFTRLSGNNEDKRHKNVKWQLFSIGWMGWDGGLTWRAPKNSSSVLTGGLQRNDVLTPEKTDLFIHAGAEKQLGLWAGEWVSTLLFHSLFGTELLGFTSPPWDWMEGTVPNANKHKFQMAHGQWAGLSLGTVWCRK